MPEVTIEQAIDLAAQHHQAGRLGQAEAIYRQVLARNPNHADALHLLGALALQAGSLDVAAQLIRRAIAINPTAANYHGNLARVLVASGRVDQAIGEYRQALALDPSDAHLWYNLGNALHKAGLFDPAAEAFREALSRRPDFADASNNLGNSLHAAGQLDQAIAAFHRAIQLQPDLAEAHNNLGSALRERGKLEESAIACRRALELQPGYADAHNNLGSALLQQLHIEDAIASFDNALAIQPGHPFAHLNLGLAYLLRGDLRRGFEHYEWRWKIGKLAEYLQDVKQPQWNGGSLDGRRILLHAEQGFGDTIQFIRYVSSVADRGGRVTLVCPPPLARLLQGFGGVETLVVHGTPLPEFDVHCPLLSLPHVLGTTLENVPPNIPYLRADARESARWRERLPANVRKVGIVWAGRASNNNDPNRSLRPELLERLGQIPGIQFISLQKDSRGSARPEIGLLNWTDELRDFADTAALIDNLDLVITVDTAAAHLAGAMGKPVWVLLPWFPDWRWMLDRTDSPWYPTMRLFRQPAPGDWDTPLQQIVEELRCLK